MAQISSNNRLESLDILRGFDLFLLLFFQPIFVLLAQQLDLSWLNAIAYQFDHKIWEGFRIWDIIMPLFLFMAGASMPFSFEKYRLNNGKKNIYKHIFRRVIILWILGAIVQGNLLGLNPHKIYLYSNTLQAIAIGYLIAAIIQLHCNFKWQIGVTISLLILYWIPMTVWGDYTPQGNFAEWIDRIVLGRFRDGVLYNSAGYWEFASWYTYTWIWSSVTFGVTVMLGAIAGTIMKHGNDKKKNALIMFLLGICFIIIALLWSIEMPIIKRIWTSSMTLFSGGICFILMAIFYYIIDYKGYHHGLCWLKYYGMNSIFAYFVGEVIDFRSVIHSITFGLENYIGNYYSILLTFGNFFLLFFILRTLYKHSIFYKI